MNYKTCSFRMGALDNIHTGKSTFMVELMVYDHMYNVFSMQDEHVSTAKIVIFINAMSGFKLSVSSRIKLLSSSWSLFVESFLNV